MQPYRTNKFNAPVKDDIYMYLLHKHLVDKILKISWAARVEIMCYDETSLPWKSFRMASQRAMYLPSC